MKLRHVTHEQFIAQVRDLALKHGTLPAEQAARVARTKMLYGIGAMGLRGITHFSGWKNGEPHPEELVEICAAGEESWIQLAGTTVHECAHVAAGPLAGHDKAWKAACFALGLRRVQAAGTRYCLASFAPKLREAITAIGHPKDGTPAIGSYGLLLKGLPPTTGRVCTVGIGTRGGTSRGPGSGSRLRKYVCSCGQIIRASTDSLQATHNDCGSVFVKE